MASMLGRVTNVLEPLLLLRAQSVARRYADPQAESVRRHAIAARRRLEAAQELTGLHSVPGAFGLLREAAALAATAVVASRQSEPCAALSAASAGERLRELVQTSRIPSLPAPLEAVARALGSDDPLSTDDLPARDLPSAKAYVLWLLGLVEVRGVAQLRRQRIARLAALCGICALVGGAALFAALAPKNLARGRLVTASSVHAGLDPSVVVDGKRGGAIGYESELEDKPWLEVDLSDHFQLDSIVVYPNETGRRTSLPRALEISDDGSSWRRVATGRNDSVDPWRVKLSHPWARYVRVQLDGEGTLSVGEVEVYGQ